jgi:membrane-bound lytic murein transglycosylase B
MQQHFLFIFRIRCFTFLLPAIIAIFFFFPSSSLAKDSGVTFSAWLDQRRAEAVNSGISQQTLDLALFNIHAPNPKVIPLDRKQPESLQTLEAYLRARINKERIRTGQKMMQRYPTWLGRIEREYGVQGRFLVALWGIESSYGKHIGTFPVIHSLVTLAYDGRRSNYFRKELFVALHLIDDGSIPYKRMQGSWAGAMGQCQFMPSSFRLYAVDADNSGSINIWASVPDVLGSAANYLAKAGWKNDQTWGREVKLPQNFDYSQVGLNVIFPLSRWQALGVRRTNGSSLPTRDLEASLIMPDGTDGSAYLVYDNFRVLMSWNRSKLFALAVGKLSDQFK